MTKFDLHLFDGFKCVEAVQNKTRKTIFDKEEKITIRFAHYAIQIFSFTFVIY